MKLLDCSNFFADSNSNLYEPTAEIKNNILLVIPLLIYSNNESKYSFLHYFFIYTHFIQVLCKMYCLFNVNAQW